MKLRLLVDEPADGAWNMALDDVLFRSAGAPDAGASLRLYEFSPFTVSYGYRQRPAELLDLDSCREHGVDWVRRPTGGRALLHQHELTYSVSAPIAGPLVGLSVRQVYDFVTSAIRTALVRLGVPVDDAAPAGRAESRGLSPSLPCLAVPERHEIASGGRKLVASAQRRSPRAFLQHGSILFRVDRELWAQIAKTSSASSLEAVGIEELLGRRVAKEALRRALVSAFEESFEARAVPGELEEAERSLVSALSPDYRADPLPSRIEVG